LINRLLLWSTLWALWLLRVFISIDRRTYMLLSLGSLQTLLARIGMMRAQAVYLKAKDSCPAYQKFLKAEGYKEPGSWKLSQLPIMTKENYVKKYSIEERCYDGKMPASGVVIDESSGSSASRITGSAAPKSVRMSNIFCS